MRKVFLTGGAGFIGHHLLKRLLADGAHVLVFDNLFVGKRELLPAGVGNFSFLQGDLRDFGQLKDAFRTFKPEIVIHLAALHFIPYCNEHPLETVSVNVNGTRNLLQVSTTYLIHKLFFISTGAAYAPQDKPHQENHAIGPVDIYGMTKLMGEELVQLFHHRTNVPCIIGRLFNTYGPREINAHLIPEILRQVKEKTGRDGAVEIALGDLRPKRDFIYVTDVVAAIAQLLNSVHRGCDIFNIGTGQSYSVEKVLKAIQNNSGKNFRIKQETSRLRSQERMNLTADIRKIRTLGWEPKISLEQGLKELTHAKPERNLPA